MRDDILHLGEILAGSESRGSRKAVEVLTCLSRADCGRENASAVRAKNTKALKINGARPGLEPEIRRLRGGCAGRRHRALETQKALAQALKCRYLRRVTNFGGSYG
jgi:hypothetical protein